MDEWSPYPDNFESSSRALPSSKSKILKYGTSDHLRKMKLKLKALDVTRSVLICYIYLVRLINYKVVEN